MSPKEPEPKNIHGEKNSNFLQWVSRGQNCLAVGGGGGGGGGDSLSTGIYA